MKVFADLGQVNKTDQLKSMDTEKKKKKSFDNCSEHVP
jgi:hypothetical protein